MKQRNFVLQLAVASILTMPLANVFAADQPIFTHSAGSVSGGKKGVDIGRNTGSAAARGPVLLASEQPIESSGDIYNVGNRLAVYMSTVPGYSVNSDNTLFIKIALKGGLKFNENFAKATLMCSTAAGSITTTAANVVSPATNGGTKITFQVKNGIKLNSSGLCAFYIASATNAGQAATGTVKWFKGLTKSDQSISAVIEYKEGVENKTKTIGGTLISFVNAGKDIVRNDKGYAGGVAGGSLNTAAKAVIDVKASSKKFVYATTPNALSDTVAYLGSVTYYATANIGLITTAGAATPAKILKTATLTVEGASVASFQKVTLYSGVSNHACSGAGSISVSPVAGASVVTFSSIPVTMMGTGINICATISGTTEVSSSQITATVGGNPQSSWIPVFEGTKDLYLLKRNGLSFRVLNIPPNVSTVTGSDTGFVRLYNVNNFKVTARGSMYNEKGEAIGASGVTLATLDSNQVKVLKVEDLQTLFGTWDKRARLLIDVDAAEFKVVSTVRSPTGVLLNLSSETEN